MDEKTLVGKPYSPEICEGYDWDGLLLTTSILMQMQRIGTMTIHLMICLLIDSRPEPIRGKEIRTMKTKFTCQTCGKILFIDPEPFRRAYEGRRECLSCRRKPAPSVEVRWR